MVRVALLALAVVVAAGPSAAAGPTLKGAVRDDFTITLTQGGKRVKTLAPGVYTFVVDDQSKIHDFHLTGPGVDKKTAVQFVGHATWTVKLVAGAYHYQCDPHSH